MLGGWVMASGAEDRRPPAASAGKTGRQQPSRKPNVLFLLADQWRADALGCAGDPNVKTPNLDRLAGESLKFTHAISGCPVCSPYRASLLTGQRPLTHGVFLNDVTLRPEAATLAKVFAGAGYDTAYVGKWHLDGHGRSAFIPRERRQGFDYWKVLECTHDYNRSPYYGDTPEKRLWQGYDAEAQTGDVRQYLRGRAGDARPFLAVLAWGPPHNPYETAPEKYRRMYDPARLILRPNVPPEAQAQARRDLAGYYAHCTALDDCVGQLQATLKETGLEENTILVFTSDHGDMLGSHGRNRKQKPWDESIRVPLLIRYPAAFGRAGRETPLLINAEDLMPTLLGLCGVRIPPAVEGRDFSGRLIAGAVPEDNAALIQCPSPFGEWLRSQGGREYRGLRTLRHTFVRDLNGPWLLYDNEADPHQLRNLCGNPEYAPLQASLDRQLRLRLAQGGDHFLSGWDYIKQWGYRVDANGTVAYQP